MPDFPRHHSERSLTTERPRALRKDADIRSDAGERAGILGDAFKAAQATTLKWQAAVEKIQADTAVYNFKMGAQEIATEAVDDKDINAEAKYQQRMQDLRKSVVKDMGNQELANRMAPELDYMTSVASLGIQKEFRQKMIIHAQTVKQGEIDMVADNPIDVKTSSKQIETYVKEGVAQGLWNEAEGYKKQRSAIAKMKENLFIQDLNNDPATTEKKLLKNKYGFDVEELDNAQKIYERELQIIRNQTEEELIDMKISGTLTEDIIQQQRQLKKIDANFAKSMIKDLNTVTIPKVEANKSVTEANILAEKYNALKKQEWGWKKASFAQRTQFRADVFDAHRKGYIDTKTMDAYLGYSSQKFFSTPEFTNAMDKAINTSKEYVGESDRKIAQQQMTEALMDKVMDGVEPSAALEEVITERLEADFPGYNGKDLMATSKQSGLSIKEVWDLLEKKRAEGK